MSKVVVIGVKGETGLWLADLEQGTVVPLKEELSGALASAAELRKDGATVVKGIDFALAASSATVIFSGVYE
ncbi:hypothetical protein [Rhizobium sp. FY34]|uniref:hypothetical protein n=1 Tax=Rhizobium sp. FY34 TaxID=2562309 RepID=UPI0010C050C1|nr:hypothetical protein [Rhizobium sp. FY34]